MTSDEVREAQELLEQIDGAARIRSGCSPRMRCRGGNWPTATQTGYPVEITLTARLLDEIAALIELRSRQRLAQLGVEVSHDEGDRERRLPACAEEAAGS